MLSDEQLSLAYINNNKIAQKGSLFARLRNVEKAVAFQIADDIDDWNAVHDADNQADADWIRQRYGRQGTDG